MTTGDITNALHIYFHALNGEDLDAIVAAFTEDASVMSPGEPTATGSDQIRDLYRESIGRLGFGRVVHVDELRHEGVLGFARCHTTGTLTLRAEDKTIDAVSRELFGLIDTPAGWRIQCYMFNQPVAVAPHG